MNNYKFRLQSVLDAREWALENRRLEMAKIQTKLKQQTDHLEYLHNLLKNTKSDLEKMLSSGKIDFILVSSHRGYIVKLDDDINNQHKLIADTEVELEMKKQEVIEANKAKIMLEKLKEKDLLAFKEKLEKRDLLEIDEITTYKSGREQMFH